MHQHDLFCPCLNSHEAEQLPPLYLHPPPHAAIFHGISSYGLQPSERVPAIASAPGQLRPNDTISHPFAALYGSLQQSASLPPSNESLSHPFAAQHGILQQSSATTLPPSQNWVGIAGSSHVLVSPRVLVTGLVASSQAVSAPVQLPSSHERMVEPQSAQNLKDHASFPKKMKRFLKHKRVKKRRLVRASDLQVLSDKTDLTMAADQCIIPTTVSPTIIDVPVETEPTVGKTKHLERGPGWCSLCQRDCATAAMLQVHIIGKKHRRKLQRENGAVQETVPAADTDINLERVPASDIFEQIWELNVSTAGQKSTLIMPESNTGKKVVDGGMVLAAVTCDHGEKKPGGEAETEEGLHNVSTGSRPRMAAADKSCEMRKQELTRCEVCNVQCDTKEVLEIHFAGKKHAARVRKLRMQNTIFHK